MADKKRELITTVIGPGIAAYTYIAKPDTQGKYADNKHKITLVVDQDAPFVEKFKAKCLEAAKREWPKAKPEKVVLPLADGDDRTDKDGNPKEEFAGKYLITAKTSKKTFQTVDAKRGAIPKSKIRAGDEVKVSVTLNPCVVSGVKRVALWLNGVQLITKNNDGGSFDTGFEDEEGYVASEDETFEDEDEEADQDSDGGEEDDDDDDF
ncbi:DUF2815 family protein [Pyruvatibacter mobilis]|uniref:DUF2815 family protein n=1 Tax=Pyruvatibacter mobilis TaxID=1712261 RepID=A0A845Q879_9HYPH|nr:ssDNA-binding protein [Pyruvatibacter mobilis]NBG94478.1 DUF2815 family protein [Pyruvatibacter mobilis]QJD73999.1 DUF2815 family protein [Pyruvatibacter mobilis]GGD03270.1 hypothetical protein GCM10011587_03730 [Pyruvatibacter mobilis]